ncbi:MAG: hypothetical protein EOO06_09145 [Chitinophagaceae bacterium]|nr:MAG: hypothetical protein EOO06_09145 [Chitinophagaceae bacterium]
MLEQLFNLVKENAQEPVINNSDIPNDQNDAVVAEATNTVASGLRNMVAGGGLQNIISMFTGAGQQQGQDSRSGLMNNPIVSMMIGHFAGKLMSKYNIGGTQANNVASGLIPQVLSGLISKTNDPSNSGFSLEGLLNSITGGKVNEVAQNSGGGFDIGSLISQLAGGANQQSSGSGGGLMDIVTQFTQGAQQQQARNGGGGLMDLIKGFIQK